MALLVATRREGLDHDEHAALMRLGVRVVDLRRLGGRDGRRNAEVRRILGRLAVAEAAWRVVKGLGLTKVLFVGADGEEMDFLCSAGAKPDPGGDLRPLFEQRVFGRIFHVRCMGRTHRVALDGLRFVPLDHTEEELELLGRLGERPTCLIMASGDLEGRLFKLDRVLSGPLMDWIVLFGQTWHEAIAGIEYAWVGEARTYERRLIVKPHAVKPGKRVRAAFVLAKRRDGWAQKWEERVVKRIAAERIPWSPITGAVAALVVNEVAGEEIVDPRTVSFRGRAAWG